MPTSESIMSPVSIRSSQFFPVETVWSPTYPKYQDGLCCYVCRAFIHEAALLYWVVSTTRQKEPSHSTAFCADNSGLSSVSKHLGLQNRELCRQLNWLSFILLLSHPPSAYCNHPLLIHVLHLEATSSDSYHAHFPLLTKIWAVGKANAWKQATGTDTKTDCHSQPHYSWGAQYASW